MSNLLKEAIVDANALREAALKSAETKIIDKYSDEVRHALDRLLEQDELGAELGAEEIEGALGGAPIGDPLAVPGELGAPEEAGTVPAEEEAVDPEEVPLAATDQIEKGDGNGLSDLSDEGEKVEFDVNLDALNEAIRSLQDQLNESEEVDLNEDEMVDILSEDDEDIDIEIDESITVGTDEIFVSDDEPDATEEDATPIPTSEKIYEDTEIPNELIDAIMEKLSVDMRADLAGWAGRSSYDMKHEMERELAHRRSTEVEEEIETLKKAQEELVFENKQLQEQNKQYKQATNELKESLHDVNLSNARLLYTNRVLRNTSLNERQKETIVEAISKAGSVTEARTIFDTLQSTAQATPKKSPQSLSEAITRRSSVIRASRHESTSSDPFQERMKRLAGIK